MSNIPLVIEASQVRSIEIKSRKINMNDGVRYVCRDVILRDQHDKPILTIIASHSVDGAHQPPKESDMLLTMIR